MIEDIWNAIVEFVEWLFNSETAAFVFDTAAAYVRVTSAVTEILGY